MKYYLFFCLLFGVTMTTFSQVHVNGYYRKNGTYVQPHYRSSPDGNPYNNYSYPGNYNPYTGAFAKGNPSTYLNRYYHCYYSYSEQNYSNYIQNLCGTNYAGMSFSNNYTTKNSVGDIIGYAEYSNDRFFNIYDVARTKIGVVKLSKNRKRFTVYSTDGYVMASNKENIGNIFLYVLGAVGLGVLIGGAASN